MGTANAALDGQYLADAIVECGVLKSALQRYDARVCALGRAAVARGRWLRAHLEAQVSKPREQRSAHELHHLPFDALFREKGVELSDVPELAKVAHGAQ